MIPFGQMGDEVDNSPLIAMGEGAKELARDDEEESDRSYMRNPEKNQRVDKVF